MIVIEFTGAINATGDTKTFYLSDRAYTTSGVDTPADEEFKSRLIDPGAIALSIFIGGGGSIAGGSAKLDIGEIIATNIDAEYDDLKLYSFDGRPILMRIGEPGSAFPDQFPVILRATMQSVMVSWGQLVINVRDQTFIFEKPVQTKRFLGNNLLPNGLEGTADDLGGQIVPRVYGIVREIAPPCVNTSKQTYRVNDGPVDDIPNVYIRQSKQTRGADHATSALLQAAAVPVGSYQTCLAEGLFRLGGADGRVTCDVYEGEEEGRTGARLLRRLALAAGVSVADIDPVDMNALDVLNEAHLGRYIDDETSFLDVMDEVARSIGAWYGFDTNGILHMGRWDLPQGFPIATLEKHEIVSEGIQRSVLEEQPTPLWSVTVNHTPIGEVQTTDLVGSVDAARRAFLSQRYRSATSTPNQEVKTQFLLAGSMTIDTLLQNGDLALVEANRVLALHDAPQDLFEVPVPLERAAELIQQGLWLGKEIAVDLARFGFEGGKTGILMGITWLRRAQEVIFDIWTTSKPPEERTVESAFTMSGVGSLVGAMQDATGPANADAIMTGSGDFAAVGNAVSATDESGQSAGLLMAILKGPPISVGGVGIAAMQGTGSFSAVAGSVQAMSSVATMVGTGDFAAEGGKLSRTLLSTPSSVIQAFTVPSNWTGSTISVEAIGAGGNGSGPVSVSVAGHGGAGGGYAKRNSLTLTPGSTIYYMEPGGGSGVDAWFNDLNLLRGSTRTGDVAYGWGLNNLASVTILQTDSAGQNTAADMVENTAATSHGLYQTVPKPANTLIRMTGIFEVRSLNLSTATHAQIELSSGGGLNGGAVHLNLSTGAISNMFNYASGGIVGTPAVTSLGGGWWRVALTMEFASTDANTEIALAVWRSNGGTATLTGTGGATIRLGRCNVTYGTLDKGYTPTLATPLYSVLAKSGPNATTGGRGIAPTTGGQGDTVFNGGDGASNNGSAISGGGGGAGGIHGGGSGGSTSAGGNADNGTVSGGTVNTAGDDGDQWSLNIGSGSGGGPRNSSAAGLAGGSYGGAGSGAGAGTGLAGGAGKPGIIVLTATVSGGTTVSTSVASMAGLGSFAAVYEPLTPAPTTGVSSTFNLTSAYDFQSRIGVNTHMDQTSNGGFYLNVTQVKNCLNYIGVKLLRDRPWGANAKNMANWGAQFLMIKDGQTASSFISELASMLNTNPGCIQAYEGPNESGGAGATAYRNEVINMHNAWNANATVKAIVKRTPPSIAGEPGQTTLVNAIGDLSAYLDYGNEHIYYWPNLQPWQILGDGTWQWSGYLRTGHLIAGATKAISISETGCPSQRYGNQHTQATQVLNTICTAWIADAPRAAPFIMPYALLDETGYPTADNNSYGFFTTTYQVKPSATALRNFLIILRNGTQSGFTGTIGYSVSGTLGSGYKGDPGHHFVVRKSQNKYMIIVWREPQVWSGDNGFEIFPAGTNVNVNLSVPIVSAQVYDPMSGSAAIANYGAVSSIPITVVDHPIMIDITV